MASYIQMCLTKIREIMKVLKEFKDIIIPLFNKCLKGISDAQDVYKAWYKVLKDVNSAFSLNFVDSLTAGPEAQVFYNMYTMTTISELVNTFTSSIYGTDAPYDSLSVQEKEMLLEKILESVGEEIINLGNISMYLNRIWLVGASTGIVFTIWNTSMAADCLQEVINIVVEMACGQIGSSLGASIGAYGGPIGCVIGSIVGSVVGKKCAPFVGRTFKDMCIFGQKCALFVGGQLRDMCKLFDINSFSTNTST